MAKVTVPLDRFKTGDFPDVCAKTGGAADASWGLSAGHLPRWSFWLLLVGVLPFFLAAWFLTKRVDGLVPLSTSATVRIVQATRLRTIGMIAGGALLLAGFVFDSQQATFAGIGAVAIASLATLIGLWWFVGGTWDPKAGTATLRRVHPTFVEAVGHN